MSKTFLNATIGFNVFIAYTLNGWGNLIFACVLLFFRLVVIKTIDDENN